MSSSTAEAAKPVAPQQFRRRTDSNSSRLWRGVALVGIAIGLGFGFWEVSRQLAPQVMSSSASQPETNSALVPQKSIAVLPFADRGAATDVLPFVANDGVGGEAGHRGPDIVRVRCLEISRKGLREVRRHRRYPSRRGASLAPLHMSSKLKNGKNARQSGVLTYG